jgi:hypothetical protein
MLEGNRKPSTFANSLPMHHTGIVSMYDITNSLKLGESPSCGVKEKGPCSAIFLFLWMDLPSRNVFYRTL